MTDQLSPEIADLAHALGVATEYWDQTGQHHDVPASTVHKVLDAMQIDVTTPAAIEAAWDRLHNGPWRRMVPHTVVATQGESKQVLVHVPSGAPVEVWIELETGGRVPMQQLEHWAEPRTIDGRLVGEAKFEVPAELPLGWHEIHARSEQGRGLPVLKQHGVLVCCPAYLGLPTAMQGRRTWGLMAQLYATRSRDSWGIGDLHDLGSVAEWAGQRGGGFVLVNPMHAAEPKAPIAPSPYLPATRRFFNPIYIRIEDIPEYDAMPALQKLTVAPLAMVASAANRTPDLIERDPIWDMKLSALKAVFEQPMTSERAASFDAYCANEGAGLEQFARWCAFAEVHGTASQLWPEGIRHPNGPGIEAEAARLADRVVFFKKCQWILDEQFAVAQSRAKAAGMNAGIVHDLAVGVHPDGADSWALQDVLAKTVNVGCPPDMYNQMGQDWSQPPWRPDALVETGYAAYRDMLRTILRHAGGIRVDHALGLFRLWWIPAGEKPFNGTFVKYDHEAMVGILALEAQRAGAFVVAEDLGTVEAWIQEYLSKRGMLGTSILWFERDEHGGPLPPERYRELCFATVTVHDLPPTAGMWAGEHIRIRESLELLARPVEEEWSDWNRERAMWLQVLRERGFVTDDYSREPSVRDVVEGLHKYLAHTPSRVIAVSLPDIVGDIRTQNQPGTDQEYPNWRVPTCDADGAAITIEDLTERADLAERADRLIAALAHRSHW